MFPNNDFRGVVTFLATDLAVPMLVPEYGLSWWRCLPANFTNSIGSTKSLFSSHRCYFSILYI